MKKVCFLLLMSCSLLAGCHYCGDATMTYSAYCVNPNSAPPANQPISDKDEVPDAGKK